MKVYLDLVFIENIVLNISVIYQLKTISKQKTTLKKIILAAILGSIYSVAIELLNNGEYIFFSNVIIKILVINIVIYVAFNPKKLNVFLKLVAYYFLIFFIYIGAIIVICTFFRINISNFFVRNAIYILGYIITNFSNKSMWKMWKSNIKSNDLVYDLIFNIDNKKINIKAFVDTGNSLKDSLNNLDIFIVENTQKLNQQMCNNYIKTEIEFKTVNAKCNVVGYIINDIKVKKNNINILNLDRAIVVFVDNKLSAENEYFSIISYDTYIEKLQGVSL